MSNGKLPLCRHRAWGGRYTVREFFSLAVLTVSVSDFEVENVTVGSNVEFLCVFDKTSMLSTLRYSSDPAGLTGDSSMLAFYDDGQFQVANETDTGRRIVVDNSSRTILNNVTVADSGFYQCRIQYRSGKEVEKKVHLRIGGILHIILF